MTVLFYLNAGELHNNIDGVFQFLTLKKSSCYSNLDEDVETWNRVLIELLHYETTPRLISGGGARRGVTHLLLDSKTITNPSYPTTFGLGYYWF